MFSSPTLYIPTSAPQQQKLASSSRTQIVKSINSSPLSERNGYSSTTSHLGSSPTSSAQARRRSQFKSRTPHGSSLPSRINPSMRSASDELAEAARKIFLREKFKARCLERAKKARSDMVSQRRDRYRSDDSSDGFDIDMDDFPAEGDDNGDATLNDELFRRIIRNEQRRLDHSYRLSYELDVGSSIDPNIHDIEEWESELKRDGPSEEVIPEDFLESQDVTEDISPDEYDEFDALYDEDIAELYEEFVRNQEPSPAVTAEASDLNTPHAPHSEHSISNPSSGTSVAVSRHPFETHQLPSLLPEDDAMQL